MTPEHAQYIIDAFSLSPKNYLFDNLHDMPYTEIKDLYVSQFHSYISSDNESRHYGIGDDVDWLFVKLSKSSATKILKHIKETEILFL